MTPTKIPTIILLFLSATMSSCATYHDFIYADSEGYYGTLHLENSVSGRRKLEALCKDTIARESAETPIAHFTLSDLNGYLVTFLIEDHSRTAPRIRLERVDWPTDKPMIDCAFEQRTKAPPQLVISYPYADHSRLLHPLSSGGPGS